MSLKPPFADEEPLKVQLDVRVAGHVTLETVGPDGKTRNKLEFDNLITDNGLELMWNSPTYAYGYSYIYNSCCVGTGNTAPAYSDTSLASYLAAVSRADAGTTNTYVAGPPTYWKAIQTYQFGTGVAAGNLTEIGFFPTNGSATSLFSRALIVDGSGNPTTLVVESDEILNVTYEFRVYFTTTDIIGTFVSDGVTYNTVQRPVDMTHPPPIQHAIPQNNNPMSISLFDGALVANTAANPTGNSYAQTYNNGGSFGSYAAGSHSINYTTVVPVNSANWANGVRCFSITGEFHKVQMSFINPDTGLGIPKVVGEQMSVTFNFTWGRYAP